METGRQGSPAQPATAAADRPVRPWLLAVPPLVVIAGVMGWWTTATADGTIGDVALLDHRPRGAAVVLSLYPVTGLDGPDRFVVGRRSQRYVVRGDPAGLAVGADVTVEGTVGDGEIVATRLLPAPQRPEKRRLGVVGLGLVALAWLAGVRPTRGGWRAAWPTS